MISREKKENKRENIMRKNTVNVAIIDWSETILAQKFFFDKMNNIKKKTRKNRTDADHSDKLISHFVLFSFSSKIHDTHVSRRVY